jgi:hypothetical protein
LKKGERRTEYGERNTEERKKEERRKRHKFQNGKLVNRRKGGGKQEAGDRKF